MARNPVQFQKGISLNAFLSLYGTEDQCFDALYQWRWPNGFLCPHCGHDRCCQLNSRKLQQCNRCHRQTSITAGTIFDSTKLPLTVWLKLIRFSGRFTRQLHNVAPHLAYAEHPASSPRAANTESFSVCATMRKASVRRVRDPHPCEENAHAPMGSKSPAFKGRASLLTRELCNIRVYVLGFMQLPDSASRSPWVSDSPAPGDDGAGYTILR